MAKPVRRQALAILRAMFPDLPDWPESPRTAPRAFSSAQTFRIEELVRDSHYVIRAEPAVPSFPAVPPWLAARTLPASPAWLAARIGDARWRWRAARIEDARWQWLAAQIRLGELTRHRLAGAVARA